MLKPLDKVRHEPFCLMMVEHWLNNKLLRGGMIHRCIDISRYFSCNTYRDIIFYNYFFILFQFFLYNDFNLGIKTT